MAVDPDIVTTATAITVSVIVDGAGNDALSVSTIVWGFGLWLTSVSVVLSAIVAAAAVFGVLKYKEYIEWRKETDEKTQALAQKVAVIENNEGATFDLSVKSRARETIIDDEKRED